MIPPEEGEQLGLFPKEATPEPLLCWLWLAHTLGFASPRAERVVDWCDDPVRIWEERDSLAFREAAGPSAARRAVAPGNTPWAFRTVVTQCQRLGIHILTYDHPDYPLALTRIPDLPLVLYCTGDPSWLNAPNLVGMVGSRRPDNYGRWGASSLGQDLARSGVVIVSGLADGLDSECHQAAVDAHAPTIGVQGVPIDRTYPASNRMLRTHIEDYGCVIGEYGPGEETHVRSSFLQRNRLIAGLVQALVVVQAREKSGTMSTVGHAERYGRPVYALPGDASRENSSGTNRLIQTGRAKMILCAGDLLEQLGLEETAPAPAKAPALSDKERRVLACLKQEPASLEDLSAGCGLEAAALSAVLMSLELCGYVKSLPGQRYIRL